MRSKIIPVKRRAKGDRRSIPILDRNQPDPEEEERLRVMFAGTTPHGREIIRKRVYAYKKELAAAQEMDGGKF
jgi:hypothetical protein